MAPKKDIKRTKSLFHEDDSDRASTEEISLLQSQIQDLQLEVDILNETIDI